MQWVREHLKVVYVAVAIIATIAIYIFLFIVPRTVLFSYAEPSACKVWPTLFPSSMQTLDNEQFTVEFKPSLKIGGVTLFSDTRCVTPTSAPKPGDTVVTAAPLGGWLFRQNIRVNVPSQPIASVSNLNKPVPTTKPLTVNLDQLDKVHNYTLRVGDREVSCASSEKAPAIQCDIVPLRLEQGKEYNLEVSRHFKKESTASVLRSNITTLTATSITEGSVKQGEIIYARPTEIRFIADKSLKKASISITEDGSSQKVALASKIEGSTIVATLAKELDREKAYKLTITGLEAVDGSSLAEPYVVGFQTSGGPKVTGVSVGKTGVPGNARITVTFDQELSASQDILSVASINGAGASSITKSGSQVIYQLSGAPVCTDFTLSISAKLMSKYDIPANTDWSYASRTSCHTLETIGYSVKGRAIQAYTFGSGASTVLYSGAIHGNEVSSSRILYDWIDYLEVNAKQLPAGRKIVVVPTVNPDGLAANSRNSARNVNLNRNFNTSDWKKDINDTNGTVAGGGGAAPASEPETQALAALSSRLRPRLVLSYHAVGSVAIGNQAGDSSSLAATYARLVGYSNGTGSSSEIFDYEITGTYDDWLAEKLGVPSIVIELGSYSYRDFSHHRQAFWTMATS